MINNKENCYLRAFEPEDYLITHKWRNDSNITKLLTGKTFFVSLEREKRWIKSKIDNDKHQIYWAICDKETNKMVGLCSIRNIDYINNKVFLGGITIDKAYWKKGYGMSANVLILKYVFEELGMNKISTNYLKEHKVTKESLKKCGFKTERVSCQDVYKSGKFHDVEYASLLKEEYFKIIEQ